MEYFIFFIVGVFFVLLDIWCVFRIRKNVLRVREMREFPRIRAEIKKWKEVYIRLSPYYVMVVAYETPDGKKEQKLKTYNGFAKKYRNEQFVELVKIPDTGKMVFAEENWWLDNVACLCWILMCTIGAIFMLGIDISWLFSVV